MIPWCRPVRVASATKRADAGLFSRLHPSSSTDERRPGGVGDHRPDIFDQGQHGERDEPVGEALEVEDFQQCIRRTVVGPSSRPA